MNYEKWWIGEEQLGKMSPISYPFLGLINYHCGRLQPYNLHSVASITKGKIFEMDSHFARV